MIIPGPAVPTGAGPKTYTERKRNGRKTAETDCGSRDRLPPQGAVFSLKAQLALQLQDPAYRTQALTAFRRSLVDDMVRKVRELDKEHFAVRQHLKCAALYSDPESYKTLTPESTRRMEQELAPLLLPDADDPRALRFDALLYSTELSFLAGKNYGGGCSDIIKKAAALKSVSGAFPEVRAQAELIDSLLHTDCLDRAGISEFELIRKKLRGLMKYT